MILQIDPVREGSLAFYIVLIVIEFRIGLFFLNAYRKNRELGFIGSAGMFFVLMAIGRFFLVIFDFYLTEMDFTLYADNFMYFKIATGLQESGFAFFFYVAERSLFGGRDRYVFTAGYIILNTVSKIIMDFNLSQTVVIYASTFVLFIPISYMITAIRAKGPIRTQALLIFFGLVLIALGSLFVGEFFMGFLEPIFGSRYAVHILAVACKLAGVLIIYQGFRQQLKE